MFKLLKIQRTKKSNIWLFLEVTLSENITNSFDSNQNNKQLVYIKSQKKKRYEQMHPHATSI